MEEQRKVTLDLSKVQPTEVTLQVAPLIDMVFLLIMFFLLVGHLVMTKKDAMTRPPVMVSPSGQPVMPAELLINVRQDGRIIVSGREVTPRQLEVSLRAELARGMKTGKDTHVEVRADRRQAFGKLNEVLQVCKKCGVETVYFCASQGDMP